MSAAFRLPRIALWVAICALLLKAGVPLLASAAAGLRGVSVAEVCHVYGVALPSSADAEHAHHHHGDDSQPAPADGARHDDHCALSALAALAPPDVSPPPGLPVAASGSPNPPAWFETPRDASADWFARRKHGPPRFA